MDEIEAYQSGRDDSATAQYARFDRLLSADDENSVPRPRLLGRRRRGGYAFYLLLLRSGCR